MSKLCCVGRGANKVDSCAIIKVIKFSWLEVHNKFRWKYFPSSIVDVNFPYLNVVMMVLFVKVICWCEAVIFRSDLEKIIIIYGGARVSTSSRAFCAYPDEHILRN